MTKEEKFKQAYQQALEFQLTAAHAVREAAEAVEQQARATAEMGNAMRIWQCHVTDTIQEKGGNPFKVCEK